MREFEIKLELDKKLIKISKKDKLFYTVIMKKIDEILNCPDMNHYKNLRYELKDSKRVHIGHFVLLFSYDQKNDFVSFEDIDHHDNVYEKK